MMAPGEAKGVDAMRGDFDRLDQRIAGEMRRWGPTLLRWSLGLVFVWFGALKPFGVSSADALIERTVTWLPPELFIPLLGWWEVAIGVCLIVRPLTRVALLLLFLQMPGTLLPLVLLPEVTFDRFPLVPTLEGQYIIKNLVLISAGLVVGGGVRRPDPAPTPAGIGRAPRPLPVVPSQRS
ncbi:MAG: FIG01041504: hypothetical protein [uncultured Thermomicrobiales bacterium]|uniref:DoxX family protein n=1 Tax=uncultured Thermomicrobiales bacterium TaxID=1645740 RepID=A0A6J4VJF3_9BACT|nr:MAG: FIG01041504: hypothetical protein [uncultured Thermomicrobiales bacterium]